MIRLKYLIQSPQVAVLRLDHQPETDHRDAEEEVCSNYAINFVEAGRFGLGVREKSWTLFSGCVFISQPGAVHRYTHSERTPSDVCLSVIYSGSFAEASDPHDHFIPSNVPVAIPPTNRLAFLKFRLKQLCSDGYELALEDWACELISAIRVRLPNANGLYRERQLSWYAERVEAIRETFETRYTEPHSLASVARSIGMSPFQLARVFSELVGSPPHQYLVRVRLNQALKMLLDGKAVTETCYDVGFSNLSHFTRSFYRRFGCVPSSLKSRRRRALSGRETLPFNDARKCKPPKFAAYDTDKSSGDASARLEIT